jgi:septum formation topological specificity factor MinE
MNIDIDKLNEELNNLVLGEMLLKATNREKEFANLVAMVKIDCEQKAEAEIVAVIKKYVKIEAEEIMELYNRYIKCDNGEGEIMSENKLFRGFEWSNKSWNAEKWGIKNGRIIFGIYDTEGRVADEMVVIWKIVGGENTPQLRVFNDSWKTLASFKDVIDAMALVDGKNITDEEFTKILLSCGFTDRTVYTKPGFAL